MGVGHVPDEPLRDVGPGGDVQGRQRRGTPPRRTPLTTRRQRVGAAGEDRVAAWYEAAGFEVVDRNWRSRTGEIDLVARSLVRDGLLVVCEVKTRSSLEFGHPGEAVGRVRQRRLRTLALEWLRLHGAHADEVRFDVAAVVGRQVDVIEAAF